MTEIYQGTNLKIPQSKLWYNLFWVASKLECAGAQRTALPRDLSSHGRPWHFKTKRFSSLSRQACGPCGIWCDDQTSLIEKKQGPYLPMVQESHMFNDFHIFSVLESMDICVRTKEKRSVEGMAQKISETCPLKEKKEVTCLCPSQNHHVSKNNIFNMFNIICHVLRSSLVFINHNRYSKSFS